MAKAKSKSKAKSKTTKKKQPVKKNPSKSKKKNIVTVQKPTAEKKNTKNQKSNKKTNVTQKDNKKQKRENQQKKGKKSNAKETKRKNDKKLPKKPIENQIEMSSLPTPVIDNNPKNEFDDLPIIMECMESDEEASQDYMSQDYSNQHQEQAEDTEPEPQQNDLNDLNCENDFDQTEDFQIDIDLTNELLEEDLTLNLDCFVNLQNLALSNDSSNEYVQSICSNDYMGINSSFETSTSLESNLNISIDNSKADEIKENKEYTMKTLQSEEVINCTCGFREEDGLMIQCDICLTWQHALCCGMNNDSEVPENYLCAYCTQPMNVRPSQRYSYAKHFLTLSKLPKFSQRTIEEELFKRRERIMTKTFELTTELRKIYKMERTVTAKLSIAEEADHPKLYMWSANWDSQGPTTDFDPMSSELALIGPIGERPIESVDCRLRLLDKIDADQQDISYRLSVIYNQLKHLDSDDFERKEEERDLKRVLRMFEKDLKTIATAAAVS